MEKTATNEFHTTSFRTPKELWREMRTLAAQQDMNLSEFILTALSEYVSKIEKNNSNGKKTE